METLRLLLLICFAIGTAHAHLGHDNRVELRLFPDRMRLVYRTSLPVAWDVLGGQAPLLADEAGKAAATPLLAKAAPSLFTVTQNGEVMTPLTADAMFEPDEHVAFVLNFGRPQRWPVTVKGDYFPQGGQMDATTLAVFDLTESPFARDVRPVLEKEIRIDSPAVSYDPGAVASAVVAGPVEAAEPEVRSDVSPQRGRTWGWLVGSAVATLLIFRGMRRIARKGVTPSCDCSETHAAGKIRTVDGKVDSRSNPKTP